jgi:hypothetical protein
MAYFQKGRTARLAVVPEWDRASALSFESRRSEIRISAYSPFGHHLLAFWLETPGAILPRSQASDGSKMFSRLPEHI